MTWPFEQGWIEELHGLWSDLGVTLRRMAVVNNLQEPAQHLVRGWRQVAVVDQCPAACRQCTSLLLSLQSRSKPFLNFRIPQISWIGTIKSSEYHYPRLAIDGNHGGYRLINTKRSYRRLEIWNAKSDIGNPAIFKVVAQPQIAAPGAGVLSPEGFENFWIITGSPRQKRFTKRCRAVL